MTVQVKGSIYQDPPLTAVGQRLVSEGSHILKCPLKSQIAISVGGGLMEFDAEFKFAKIQNSHVEGEGGSWNLMLSSNLLKSKIPMLRVGGWVGGLMEFDTEFKFAKIQNSRVEGGGGGRLMEFDAEFKFAKIQNSHVEGGWVDGGRGLWNLMVSSNLLKFKIPMLRVGGGAHRI